MSALKYGRSFIDGIWVDGNGSSWQLVNPATSHSIGRISASSDEQVKAAVLAAQVAFKSWKRLPGLERGRILRRASDWLRERHDEIASVEVMQSGKPIHEARTVDLPSVYDVLEYFAGATVAGSCHEIGSAQIMVRREPIGVCAGIGAWNYPLQIAAWKIAPALACGNTMIFKPSEMTPLTVGYLVAALTAAGLPKGVLNLVQGGGEVGQMLSRAPEIRKISLTGSVNTGKAIAREASASLKAVTLELGGKSPLLILADADLEQAVFGAMQANFFTQGEVCSNATRVYVAAELYDQFLEALLPRVKAMRIGDPMEASTQVGALISATHRDRVEAMVKRACSEGARVLCGGQRPMLKNSAVASGFFYEPTVLVDVPEESEMACEEVFGPVMTVFRFHDLEEAVRSANQSSFGLGAGIFTRDLAKAHKLAAELEAGNVWINNYNVTPVEVPFGGMKQSGIGRENGQAAIEAYTQYKTVYIETEPMMAPFAFGDGDAKS